MKPTFFVAAGVFALSSTALWADGITISDAYARSATPSAMSGAAFMVITNESDAPDRLIDVRSDAATRVELHTHIMTDGVMQMTHLAEGREIAAGETHMLERGGDHVMFMGLASGWRQGDLVHLTLVFEKGGEVELGIPVDLER